MLTGTDVCLVSLDRFPDCPEVLEDGSSFAENALKKAGTIAAHTGHISIADDSGIEVDALEGRPGIYSARYAGPEADDLQNNTKLLGELEGHPAEKRGAQFRCVIALAAPDGTHQVVEGVCRGVIADAPRGSNGFGYDPLFLDETSGRTFAEMGSEYKNRISHRFQAIRELQKVLPEFLEKVNNQSLNVKRKG